MQTPRTLNDAVAAELRADRAAAQLSQRELADMSGLSESTVIRVERGRVEITTKHIAALCAALKVEPVDLFTRAQKRLDRV